MSNIDLLNRALTVVQVLRSSDHECVIAGGAARDMAHGVSFKDVDIIVHSEYTGLYDLLALLGFTCHEDNEYQNSEDCGRIRSVWKMDDIDVIVYNQDLYESLEDCVARGFDCNMSQYVLTNNEAQGWTIMTLHNEPYKVVKLLRDDISTKRMERLIEIAERIGWDSTELQQRVTEAKEREGKIPTFG